MKKGKKKGNGGGWKSPFSRRKQSPEQLTHAPSIGPIESMCGKRAYFMRKDAPGVPACRACGLYHRAVEA